MRSFMRRRDNLEAGEGWSRKMQPTQGVSYPRSGHEAVYQIARRYFGDTFVYCDTNNKAECGCGSVPCINPGRTFSKNHDFGVYDSAGVPIIPSEHYFIQFRNPVRSIVSNYYLYRREHRFRFRRVDWQKFALRSITYWNRFIDKWVLNFPSDAQAPLYCSYEALIADPEARMREILLFLSNEPLDEEAVSRLLIEKPISPRNRITEFRFYDPVSLRELEDLASERLAKLGLPSFMEEI